MEPDTLSGALKACMNLFAYWLHFLVMLDIVPVNRTAFSLKNKNIKKKECRKLKRDKLRLSSF